MSSTQPRDVSGQRVQRMTAAALLEKKRAGEAITALTAYDYPSARLMDEAGIDLLLVGDSLGMTVLGYENTLPVTMDEMLHHTRAVARSRAACLSSCGHAVWVVPRVRRRRPCATRCAL